MLRKITYILLDAARMGRQMDEAKARNKTHGSLYHGGSEAALSGLAPHIFQFAHPTQFSTYFLKTGWGESWGVLLKSSWPPSELLKHFRKFLRVKTEDGKELYFRFYDPRVLRIFLPTCDAAQIREFFGGAVDYFIVEDEDPDYALQFFHQNGVLQTERFSIKEVLDTLPELEPLPPRAEDPLPPETIEALKEQGITLPLPESTVEPAPNAVPKPEPDETPLLQSSTPVSAPALPPSKPKTKWNMFD